MDNEDGQTRNWEEMLLNSSTISHAISMIEGRYPIQAELFKGNHEALTTLLAESRAEVERLREELSEAKEWCPYCGDNLP